jgi:hypothetical protein
MLKKWQKCKHFFSENYCEACFFTIVFVHTDNRMNRYCY